MQDGSNSTQARPYYAPTGGLPPQTRLLTDRAVFTNAYAVIPKGVLTDIVTSRLPFWSGTRAWVIARPLSGFAETFSHYIVEVASGGGSDRPEPDPQAEAVVFIVEGSLTLAIDGISHEMGEGGYAFIPPVQNGRRPIPHRRPFDFIGSARLTKPSTASTAPRHSSSTKET